MEQENTQTEAPCFECGFEPGSDRPGTRGCETCGATLPYRLRLQGDFVHCHEAYWADAHGRIGYVRDRGNKQFTASIQTGRGLWVEGTGRSRAAAVRTAVQEWTRERTR